MWHWRHQPERAMHMPWLELLATRTYGRIVVVAGDRVLGLLDGGPQAHWIAVVPRRSQGAVWAAAVAPSSSWPFLSEGVWTEGDQAVRWFGPVPPPVREMVASGGPRTAAMASPTAITVLADGPTTGLVAADGFERWLAFVTTLVGRAGA